MPSTRLRTTLLSVGLLVQTPDSSNAFKTTKIIDFDADTITDSVSFKHNTLFSEDAPIVTSKTSSGYGGPRVYGGFVDSSETGKWGAFDQARSGLKIRWGDHKGEVGDDISGLFLFSKEDFTNDGNEEVVTIDESSKITAVISSGGAVSSSSISFVFSDSVGYHISSPILCDSLDSGYPFTFHPKSLIFYDFEPYENGEETVGRKGERSVPSFSDVSFVGFRLDARRGVDTFEAVDVGVKLFTVHALLPLPSLVSGTKTTRITLKGKQRMEGFGATVAFNISRLLNNKHADELSVLLFKDLNLDILRIRNWYQADDSEDGYEKEIKDTIEVIKLGEKALGRELMTLLTSWTAPSSLKSNSACNGGTISYDPTNIMDYHYQQYGQWWSASLIHYQSLGVYPEYLSIQNQPNNDSKKHPSMKLEPSQLKEDAIAGYNMAIEAAAQDMNLNDKINDIPLFVGPETVGFDNAMKGDKAYPIDHYIGNLVFQKTIYAWAHQLYQGNVATDPDALNDKMERFYGGQARKPIFITEYYNTKAINKKRWERMWHHAKVMHNALTMESASAFFYKNLYGNGSDALVSLPDNSSYKLSPEYYAFKHYSAFVDRDMIRVETSTEESGVFLSAYSSESSDKLAVIILNENVDAIQLHLEFDSISITGGEVYRSSKKGMNCQKVGEFVPADDRMKYEVEGESITTFYLDYVSPYRVRDELEDAMNYGEW